MRHLFIMLVLAVFTAGIGIGSLIGLQLPTSDAFDVETYTTSSRGLTFTTVQTGTSESVETEPLHSVAQEPDFGGPVERISPGDWIKESQIEMRPDGVFIHFNNPQWAILADTNSMDPVSDAGSHLIQAVPLSVDEIQVGDIISYASPLGFTIVHRAIEINNDEDGWYAIAKGDNNPSRDPWKIRFEDIRRVTVMIIY